MLFSPGALAVLIGECDKMCGCVLLEFVWFLPKPVQVSTESERGWRVGGRRFCLSIMQHAMHTRAVTCLRGFQYPVCVSVFVFSQGLQFIIFVCLSGYYISSPTHMRTEADGARGPWGTTLLPPAQETPNKLLKSQTSSQSLKDFNIGCCSMPSALKSVDVCKKTSGGIH